MIDPQESLISPEALEDDLQQPSTNFEPQSPQPELYSATQNRLAGRKARRHFWQIGLLNTLKSLLIAVGFALAIRATILSAFIIPSGSMKDTLLVGDVILVNRFVYRFTPPQRGDLIVFRQPHGIRNFLVGDWLAENWWSFSRDVEPKHQDLVKRVIGIPGDTVRILGGKVYITTSDGGAYHLEEPYLPEPFYDNWGPKSIPESQYLVMGDNRNHSADGRWFGLIPSNLLMGRALGIIFSIAPDTCQDNNLYDSRCSAIVVPLPNNDLKGRKPELPGGNGNYWVCPTPCLAGSNLAYRDWWDKHAGPVWERLRWSRIGEILLDKAGPRLESYP